MTLDGKMAEELRFYQKTMGIKYEKSGATEIITTGEVGKLPLNLHQLEFLYPLLVGYTTKIETLESLVPSRRSCLPTRQPFDSGLADELP